MFSSISTSPIRDTRTTRLTFLICLSISLKSTRIIQVFVEVEHRGQNEPERIPLGMVNLQVFAVMASRESRHSIVAAVRRCDEV